MPPNSPIDFSPGGPNFQRTVNVERQLDGDACKEAMSLLNHTTDNSLIFQMMRETFQHLSVRSLLMTQSEVLIYSQASHDSWLQKYW